MNPQQPDPGRLTIAISSRALFDLESSHQLYLTQGLQAFEDFQRRNEQVLLEPGMAFGLVQKLMRINSLLGRPVIEVILLSRNSSETGLRVFNAIEHYQLPIVRAVFTNGAHDRQLVVRTGIEYA
jgi:5'-nucleotidase